MQELCLKGLARSIDLLQPCCGQSHDLRGIALILFIALVIVLAVVAAAMQGIFVTALYSYAKTGTVPSLFKPDLIQNVFVRKQNGSGTI
jgi:hypothetical protein